MPSPNRFTPCTAYTGNERLLFVKSVAHEGWGMTGGGEADGRRRASCIDSRRAMFQCTLESLARSDRVDCFVSQGVIFSIYVSRSLAITAARADL